MDARTTRTSSSHAAKPAHARGVALLRDPETNRGTAFTEAERDAFGLRGLLPPHVSTQDEQVRRVLENLHRLPGDLERYMSLAALLNRNESLFFRVLTERLDELMPIVYTPTVGLACQQFGHIFERPRGMFVSAHDRGRVAEVLANWPHRDVAIVVVTDGERILGLGDLGANGMAISVGKLALYSACAGIVPRACLPIQIDVGTENASLLSDPLYVGLRERRMRGAEYDALLDEFIEAVGALFPGVIVQFEDFATAHAFDLLQRWRDRICTFNDDIQGTAAVTLAGLRSAARVKGTKLADERVLCLGAGEAAVGISELFVSALREEGLSDADAVARVWLFDKQGLVVAQREDLAPHQRRYAHARPATSDLLTAIETFRPTALIGVSGAPGTFTRAVLESMARLNQRPIVFALSNPTSRAECSAEEAYRWTDGRALFACGSPFAPVNFEGRTFVPRQGNNAYVFPGIGLGVIASRARRVTDAMFAAAARALAETVTSADLAQGSLYPPLANVRAVSMRIATAVAEVAFASGVASIERPSDVAAHVAARMWDPTYRSIV